MKYIRVKWPHSFPDEPTMLYSELDDSRAEIRKMELYRDGRSGFASATLSFGGTQLSAEPVPSLDKIAADAQFEPSQISQGEFERVWATRESGQSR